MLGVPRPTLYRYLKEYSVPYQRRSGRISIPQESLDRIRMVRELHDEGLGTGAVRRRIREGSGNDVDRIADRLEQLERKLESTQSSARTSDSGASSQALQVVMARQSLLISSIFNLTEMMEELLAAAGRPRKVSAGFPEDGHELIEPPGQDAVALDAVQLPETTAGAASRVPRALPAPVARGSFESLARRRRRARLVVIFMVTLAVMLAAAGLMWAGAALF